MLCIIYVFPNTKMIIKKKIENGAKKIKKVYAFLCGSICPAPLCSAQYPNSFLYFSPLTCVVRLVWR